MKQSELYAKLELIPLELQSAYVASSRWNSLKQSLNKVIDTIWQVMIQPMAGSTEPKITECYDRMGHPVFKVYDPIVRQNLYFHSEAAVRIWLDQRYNMS